MTYPKAIVAAVACLGGAIIIGQLAPSIGETRGDGYRIAGATPRGTEVAIANPPTRGKGGSLKHLDPTCRSKPGKRCG